MNGRKRGGQLVEAVLVITIIALVLGQLFGQPILLGFVESGSMEPTIEEEEGYLAVPAQLSGAVEEGDVIVFKAQELHGGGLTTHRVVGETEDGYITKGDGNPFRDQDGEEPPVQEGQIVAKVVQVNGHVVTIPALGSAVNSVHSAAASLQGLLGETLGTNIFRGTQGLLNSVVVMCFLLYGALLFAGRRGRQREQEAARRTGFNAHSIVVLLTLFIVIVATLTMLAPAETHQLAVGASDVPADETTTTTIQVANSGVLPMYSAFEPQSTGISIDKSIVYIDTHDSVEVDVTVSGPSERETANRVFSEYRYLVVFPPSIMYALHNIHPWLALATVNAVIAIPFYGLGVLLLGTGQMRIRPRREVPLATRIRRMIRGRD